MSLNVSVLTGGVNNFSTTSEMVNFPVTDFINPGVTGPITNTSGVAPATGSMAVNAQGTPDMTVAVSSGVCYVTATPSGGNSQLLRVRNTASSNVTIAANATGGTRFDWVYVKVDATKAAAPASDASDVATLVTSRSTSATTDNGTPPTYGTLIAIVTVANGAVTISNGNISDKRVVSTFRGSPAASGVNSLNFVTNTTGSAPSVRAQSAVDSNVDVAIVPLGTGAVTNGTQKIDWWQELGRTTLSGAADIISVTNVPARKYLLVLVYAIATGGTINVNFQFNADTGANYANRYSGNGAADTTNVSQTAGITNTAVANNHFVKAEIINILAQPKIAMHQAHLEGTSGAANAPNRAEGIFKWHNTSAQITRVDATNSGTGDYAIGSEVVVLGHD